MGAQQTARHRASLRRAASLLLLPLRLSVRMGECYTE